MYLHNSLTKIVMEKCDTAVILKDRTPGGVVYCNLYIDVQEYSFIVIIFQESFSVASGIFVSEGTRLNINEPQSDLLSTASG